MASWFAGLVQGWFNLEAMESDEQTKQTRRKHLKEANIAAYYTRNATKLFKPRYNRQAYLVYDTGPVMSITTWGAAEAMYEHAQVQKARKEAEEQ